jgi:intein/homing endonuclease
MFAADGCLQKKYICMWGNIYQDKDYYNRVVCQLFSKVFNKNVIAHEKRSNSVYGFYLCNKDAVKLFRNLGFTNNKTYDVQIPKKVLDSNDKGIYAAFVRGFADCDGGIDFLKRKGKYKPFKLDYNTYPRIEMVSVSHEIIKQVSSLLNKLDIKHTSYYKKSVEINERVALKISIRGSLRVEEFMKKIGFNNPGHYTKYLIWKKFKMCPPKTILEQRKLILNGEINPFDFYNKKNAPDRI